MHDLHGKILSLCGRLSGEEIRAEAFQEEARSDGTSKLSLFIYPRGLRVTPEQGGRCSTPMRRSAGRWSGVFSARVSLGFRSRNVSYPSCRSLAWTPETSMPSGSRSKERLLRLVEDSRS
ncbi:hypothetical protein MPNT_100027 [Candidatus Methylacidithermus pantelleriae]|uniref:Uncharacterized protein n=1 Tax=Candidatus Methylacidithermus pantelleriae TaxID=2744239 RepID=A0A8J2BR91_9BACT|nr:hypothetical protein MPNT_100027 [Candidatus Methylacidithermus pantelleriae]